MKKLIPLLCALALALSLAACSGKTENTGKTPEADASAAQSGEVATDRNGKTIPSNIPQSAVTDMPETFDSMEYVLYMNIFSYKDQNDPSKGMGGDDYVGEKQTKEGTFFKLRDEYNKKDRYYVWGYADQTRCCDYQWEFVPDDVTALPAPGSRIKVQGTFSKSSDALDGYWLTSPTVTVEKESAAPAYELDLTTASPTLARVQIQNMQQFASVFTGKTLRVFGRLYAANCIQHPYYDGAWQMDFTGTDQTSAPGTYLLIGGTFTAGEENGSYLAVESYNEVTV